MIAKNVESAFMEINRERKLLEYGYPQLRKALLCTISGSKINNL